MVKQRHLKDAPITEALFDFRVKQRSDFKAESFSNLEKELGDKYPKKRSLNIIEKSFVFDTKSAEFGFKENERQEIRGYSYQSIDEKNVAQFRIDGFTHNRLKPYTSWENVFSESKRLWKIYEKTAQVELITRIAVRYINHLVIKVPIIELAEYITNPPTIPSNVPQLMSGFLTKVRIQDLERELAANITQTSEKSIKEGHLTIILDIDVYKKQDFNPSEMDKIWGIFEHMRELKNNIFFNSITEKAIEKGLYE